MCLCVVVPGVCFGFIKLINYPKWSSCLSARREEEIKKTEGMGGTGERGEWENHDGEEKEGEDSRLKERIKARARTGLRGLQSGECAMREGRRGRSKAITKKRGNKRSRNNTWIFSSGREREEKDGKEAGGKSDCLGDRLLLPLLHQGPDSVQSQLKHNAPSLTR